MRLHGYFRSSASWRVRIALALKGRSFDSVTHHLRKGEQRDSAYLAINPQGLVPSLELADGEVLTQSLAMIEYLEEVYPDPPLLPGSPVDRARIRAVALAIATDIHPLQNLKILQRLSAYSERPNAGPSWSCEAMSEGLAAVSALLERTDGPFAFGAAPTLADICLVPQLANARRFGLDIPWTRLLEIEAACLGHEAFQTAAPEAQPDAEPQ